MRRHGVSSVVWLNIYPVLFGVCMVHCAEQDLILTLHSAPYTHQIGLDKYAATRRN